MSNLENWLEENQWQLCTTEVKDLREAVAADIEEALKTAHNSESTQCLSYEQCTGRLTDGCFNGTKSCYRG